MPHTRSFHGVAGRAYGLVRFARRVEVNGARGQPLRPHHRVVALGPPALVLLRWLRPPPARHGVHGRADRGKKKQMPGDDSRPTREGRAREDDHDPSAGLAGAAPASSALTLRLILASFGLIACGLGAAAFLIVLDEPRIAGA